jgi:hypothetical protein
MPAFDVRDGLPRRHCFRFLLGCLCAAGALLIGFPGHATTIHVFLDGGQSNGDGRAPITDLPANLQVHQTDVLFYSTYSGGLTTLYPGSIANSATFGPDITFGRSMADYYASMGEMVAILKYSPGGTNLYTQWKADGTGSSASDGAQYKTFQSTVLNGLNALKAANPGATIKIDGMIWMQGESDAIAAQSANYQLNLTAFIADIRLTYGASLPFVLGELSSAQTGTGAAADRNTVRTAQVAVDAADPLTKLVNTDSFGLNSDKLHFNAAGQQALGYAFASQMQSLVAVPEPSPLALVVLSGLAVLVFKAARRKPPVGNPPQA